MPRIWSLWQCEQMMIYFFLLSSFRHLLLFEGIGYASRYCRREVTEASFERGILVPVSVMRRWFGYTLLRNWLQDLAAEQFEVDRGGILPLVCPDTLKKDWLNIPQAIWDNVTVLIPFVIYQFTSNRIILS